MLKETLIALGVVTLAGSAAVLPVAKAHANDLGVQIAVCNPCAAKAPCNRCAAANPGNPCAAKAIPAANPCAAVNPCNPCAAKTD
ncbi:MAG: hypothetical protein ACREDZ_00140 [Kiloniellales bacterium]